MPCNLVPCCMRCMRCWAMLARGLSQTNCRCRSGSVLFCFLLFSYESRELYTYDVYFSRVGGRRVTFFSPLTFVFRVTLGFCFGGLKYIKKDATIAATWWTEARDQSTYYAKNKKMHAFCVLKSCCAPAVGNRDFCCIYEVPVLFVFSTIDVLLLSYICPVALYMSDVLCVIRYKVSGVFVI